MPKVSSEPSLVPSGGIKGRQPKLHHLSSSVECTFPAAAAAMLAAAAEKSWRLVGRTLTFHATTDGYVLYRDRLKGGS